MADIKIYDTIVKSELITKGFSGDKKYCAATADGTKYLLRIAPITQYKTVVHYRLIVGGKLKWKLA